MAPPQPWRLVLLTAPRENALTWVSDISEDSACWCESLTRPLILSVDRQPPMSVKAARITGTRAVRRPLNRPYPCVAAAGQPSVADALWQAKESRETREHICRKQTMQKFPPSPTSHFLQREHGSIFAFLKLRLSKIRTFINLS